MYINLQENIALRYSSKETMCSGPLNFKICSYSHLDLPISTWINFNPSMDK